MGWEGKGGEHTHTHTHTSQVTRAANMRKIFPGFGWGVALFGVACFVEHFVERAEHNEKKLSGSASGHHW